MRVILWSAMRVRTSVSQACGSTSWSFDVALETQPTGVVTVGFDVDTPGQVSLSPTSVSFDGSSWNDTVSVLVTPTEETVYDGTVTVAVELVVP